MKPATLILLALVALIPVFSTEAQDYEDANLVDNLDDSEIDPDVKAEGRTLGAVPAFGLGLLGGTVGSSLIRGVGNLLGLRSQPPLLRPAIPATFYPAPMYIPAGLPLPPYPPFPGRSSGLGRPGPGVGGDVDPRKPYVPKLSPYAPYVPGPTFGYFRSEDEDQEGEEVPEDETTLNY